MRKAMLAGMVAAAAASAGCANKGPDEGAGPATRSICRSIPITWRPVCQRRCALVTAVRAVAGHGRVLDHHPPVPHKIRYVN